MDFRNWMRKLDGKSYVPNRRVDQGYGTVGGVCLVTCQKVLDGDAARLSCAFFWSSTRQGGVYWQDRKHGTEPMSQEDLEYIRGLIDYYEEESVDVVDTGVPW